MRSEDALQQTVLRTTHMPSTQDRLRHGLAQRWPQLYGLVLVLTALPGAVFPFAFPLLGVAMLASLVGQLFALDTGFSFQLFLSHLALLVLAGAMSWYLWQERPALPQGRRLDAREAPLLYPLLADLQQHFGKVDFEQIILSPEYELRVERTPVNGYPLRLRNSLIIGLPVLESLSAPQLQVLLAREVGYLAQARRRPGAWLMAVNDISRAYRSHYRAGWGPQQLLPRLFYALHAPVYAWMSQEHGRQEQRLANHHPMELINDDVVAQALVSDHFAQYVMHHQYWPAIYKGAQRHPTPKHPPYLNLENYMRRAYRKGASAYWLTHVLGHYQKTPHGPTLAEHLQEIGHSRIPEPRGFDQPASRQLLPARLDAIRVQMDRAWLDENLAAWKQQYSQNQRQWERMKQLIVQAQNGRLSAEDAWECAQLIQAQLNDRQEVSGYYRQLLTACPDCARLHYFIGRYLLAGNEADGVQAIESAMRQDAGYVPDGCQLITRYLMRTGQRKAAQEYRRKALAYGVTAAD